MPFLFFEKHIFCTYSICKIICQFALILHKNINKQTEKYFSEYKYHQYGEKHIHHNRVYPDVEESFVKISTDGKGNDYTYIKNTDGTKTFIKNINGINYTFTNAK